MASGRRTWVGWLVVLLWAVGLGAWAFTPLNDSVPTGVVDDKATFEKLECSAPIDGNARPDSFSLPELEPPRQYARPPCEQTHSVNRNMFVFNAVLIVLVGAVLASIEIRRRRVADSTATPVTIDS